MSKNKKGITIKAEVYPSKFEESKEGWVWLPPQLRVKTDFILIRNPKNKRYIIAEKRTIDKNYLDSHKKLKDNCNNLDSCIVMSEFYRKKLGIKKREYLELEIREVKSPIKKYIRAPLHHPNAFVRVSITVGILSFIIGCIGILLTLCFRYLS